MSDRLAAAQAAFSALGAEVALITDPANRRWLTGFTGSAGIVVLAGGKAELVTDGRYTLQAAAESTAGVQVITASRGGRPWLRERLAGVTGPVAMEADHLTVAEMADLEQDLGHLTWLATRGVLARLRLIKDDQERALIRHAFQIADRAFASLLDTMTEGVTEIELALTLEAEMRRAGAGCGFDTIVASGPGAALPHGHPTNRRLAQGDLVIVDWGASWQGYTSDTTRTVAIGRLDQRGRQIYHLVRAAMEAAIAVVKPGVAAKAVHEAAFAVIAEAGYGAQFVHSTGHGVGLEVHEAPALAAHSDDVLCSGMVVTVEPGIYIEGYGGVRLEQTGIITEGGMELLSHLATDLQIL